MADLPARVKKVVENPIGSRSLSELVSPRSKITIICDDQTRPTPAGQLINPIVEELNRLGVPDESITIVVGRGTHALASEEQLRAKLGADLMGRFKVLVHDPDNIESLKYVGTTSRGTPVWINKLVAEADVKIGVGMIVAHPFAGYSGGPKIVMPGICGRKTIAWNHSYGRDPKTALGIREGNPIWEDMLEMARLAELDMKVDAILNIRNEVINVFAGDVDLEQREGIKEYLKLYETPIPKVADVVIAAGYPLEAELLQSTKGLLAGSMALREGGALILATAMYNGFGPGFYEAITVKPKPDYFDWIMKLKITPTAGILAARTRETAERNHVTLITDNASRSSVEDMHMKYAKSIDEAIKANLADFPDADVVVFPAGSAILPKIG
jgi:nickel-dependent lactate racemase